MSQYATISDLYRHGARAEAFSGLSSAVLDAGLQAASGKIDSALRTHRANTQLPLTAWGEDVRIAVCKLAAYEILSVRGHASGDDGNLLVRHTQAEAWRRALARGEEHLDVEPAFTNASQGSAVVVSNTRRGF